METEKWPVMEDEGRGKSRRKIIIAAVAVAAVAAVAVGATIISKSSKSTSTKSSGNSTSSGGTSKKSDSGTLGFGNGSSSGTNAKVTAGGGNSTRKSTAPTSDPSKETYGLHALAIGDWGVSTDGTSCCSKYNKTKGPSLYMDEQAQDNVAYLLSLSAQELKPKCIIGHGDNFYWNGIASGDKASRFHDTYEAKYSQDSLQDIVWFSVMGNHDYGGAAYICGDRDNEWTECKTQQEVEDALDGRFDAQSTYVSPNGNRWKLPKHYYKESITDGTVTVDIFNVDTNAATVHGGEQICCQCFSYAPNVKKTDPTYVDCDSIHRGDKYCFGGNTDLFDACMAKFTSWTDDSLKQLISDTASSTADWKIVNSHYSPHYHMDPTMMKTWQDALAKGGVQLFINGHSHAESHDFSTINTHFITNGAGGGIQSEALGPPPGYATNVKQVWVGANNPYGFFELSFSKDWLRARFITFDKSWVFAEQESATVKGSKEIDHCWYIPNDGSEGKEC